MLTYKNSIDNKSVLVETMAQYMNQWCSSSVAHIALLGLICVKYFQDVYDYFPLDLLEAITHTDGS